MLPPALDPIGSLGVDLTSHTLELPNLHVSVFSEVLKLGTVNTVFNGNEVHVLTYDITI